MKAVTRRTKYKRVQFDREDQDSQDEDSHPDLEIAGSEKTEEGEVGEEDGIMVDTGETEMETLSVASMERLGIKMNSEDLIDLEAEVEAGSGPVSQEQLRDFVKGVGNKRQIRQKIRMWLNLRQKLAQPALSTHSTTVSLPVTETGMANAEQEYLGNRAGTIMAVAVVFTLVTLIVCIITASSESNIVSGKMSCQKNVACETLEDSALYGAITLDNNAQSVCQGLCDSLSTCQGFSLQHSDMPSCTLLRAKCTTPSPTQGVTLCQYI